MMDITLTIIVFAIVLTLLAYGYECALDRLQMKSNEWREAYRKRLDAYAQSSVVDAEQLAETRRALRRCQELNEELQDEVDRLDAERVVPESCGAGGQC